MITSTLLGYQIFCCSRLIITDDSDINTPAVAAAYAVKRYNKQAQDEISFEVRKKNGLKCVLRDFIPGARETSTCLLSLYIFIVEVTKLYKQQKKYHHSQVIGHRKTGPKNHRIKLCVT